MKNKKIVLGISILILSFLIPFPSINYSFAPETQNNLKEVPEVRKAATKTAILRPNGDILTEWDGAPTPHWSRINEVNPNNVYSRWIDGDENQTEIYAMENLDLNVNATKLYFISISSIQLNAYGFRYYTGPAFVSIYLGEWTSKLELNLPTGGSTWRTCVWNNLDGTYEDLKDLQVNITAGVWCDSSGYGRIDTLYCEITYDIVELPGDTATLRPNEDILIEWDGAPSPHWSRIDETSIDGLYALWIDGDENQSDIFGMQDAYFEKAIVTSVELHAYGYRYYTGPAFVSIYLGEWTPKLELNLPTGDLPIWRTCVWNNLDGTYEDLKDLQVNITAGVWCSTYGYGGIDIMYCVITIEEPILKVVTPENKTYIKPMSGYYPATCGFENAQDGEMPIEHNWNSLGFGTKPYVVNEMKGHKKVVYSYDNHSALGGEYGNLRYFFDNNQIKGIIEWWWYIPPDYGSNLTYHVKLQGGSFTAIELSSQNNYFKDTHGSVMTYETDRWYHHRIIFDCENGTKGRYSWYIDEILVRFNVEMDFDVNNINYIDICGSYTSYGAGYFDAFGFSWDSNYIIGDNTKEGLLLSYQTDIDLDWIGYSLNGQDNITIYGNCTILPEDGAHRIQLFGNDSMGYIYFSEIKYFYMDILEPIITIVSPDSNEFFSSNAPDFELFINEVTLNSTWYTLDGGITNITFTRLTGTIDQTKWEGLMDGPVPLVFYANDSNGKLGKAEIIIHKDTNIPQITIISPSLNNFYGVTAPNFELSIDEIYLESTWYSLDGGITNNTFIGLIGTINQTEWDGFNEGLIIIRFYANDSWGHIGYSEVTIYKDVTPPSSMISYVPYKQSNVILETTNFTITADDGSGSGISIIRYKINDSSWMDYSSPFNLSGYRLGYYKISYQTIDNLGNIEDENIVIVKLEELPQGGELFEGDPMPIIITISALSGGIIVSALIIYTLKRRKRKA